jgi:phytoene synthase
MEMDAAEDISAPEMKALDLYCDRVACAVGRLSVRIFGMKRGKGVALAHHLGRALQLTNILRDLDEDAARGRLYLPREVLVREGIEETGPLAVLASPALGRVCVSVARLAHVHFEQAGAIMAAEPRVQIRAPLIMAEAYRSILRGLIERGFAPPREPVRLGKVQMARALLRAYVL